MLLVGIFDLNWLLSWLWMIFISCWCRCINITPNFWAKVFTLDSHDVKVAHKTADLVARNKYLRFKLANFTRLDDLLVRHSHSYLVTFCNDELDTCWPISLAVVLELPSIQEFLAC